MAGMVTHTPVTEQIRRTPIPLSLQVNPSLMPSVESVVVYFQFPGEAMWNSKSMVHSSGGVFTAKIDCADGMYIFDPETVSYYIVVTGVGGTVLVNEPVGQAAAPHVIRMVNMLAGQPPTLPGMGPEMKCREITCFSTKECEKELGAGSECFEGICTMPAKPGGGEGPGKGPRPKGKGFPGLLMINVGVTPYGFGLVSGKAYDKFIPYSDDGINWIYREGPTIDAGMAGSGPSLRFAMGYFLEFGLGFTAWMRLQFLRGDNKGWDDGFDLLGAGARINFMAVRKKLILLNVYLGGGYGKYRHKIADVPNPCYVNPSLPSSHYYCGTPEGLALVNKGYFIDFWRAAGLFDLSAGTQLIIRPVKVFGITIDLGLDFLVPTFAMNIDASIGVALFFGNGFKEKKKAAAEPTFSDPMMY
jgi:hypothetical protein